MENKTRILVQYPTKGRPAQMLSTLRQWIDSASCVKDGPIEVLIHIVAEQSDGKTLDAIKASGVNPTHIQVQTSTHQTGTKIGAINWLPKRVLDQFNPDIIMMIAEDYVSPARGWDSTVASDMKKYFADGDGVVHYFDGFTGDQRLCTHPVIGRKYYDRFGYIHFPLYFGAYSDNEMTEVAKCLGKIKYIPRQIATHEWIGKKPDRVFRADQVNFKRDQSVFNSRRHIWTSGHAESLFKNDGRKP